MIFFLFDSFFQMSEPKPETIQFIAFSMLKTLPFTKPDNVFSEWMSIDIDDSKNGQILSIHRIADNKYTVDLESDTKDDETRHFDYVKCCEFIKSCGNIIGIDFVYMKIGKKGKYMSSMVIYDHRNN